MTGAELAALGEDPRKCCCGRYMVDHGGPEDCATAAAFGAWQERSRIVAAMRGRSLALELQGYGREAYALDLEASRLEKL